MKIILVVYINIDNLENSEIRSFLTKIAKQLGDYNDDMISLVLPVYNQPTRVECLNPQILSNKELSKQYKKEIYKLESSMATMAYLSSQGNKMSDGFLDSIKDIIKLIKVGKGKE